MNKNYCYLAGPMEDCSADHMTGWRTTASQVLETAEITTLDFTRRVPFHDHLNEYERLEDSVKNMNICKRNFKQDLQDIARSTVVLADVRRSSGRGTGTSMELMFAHMKNKIIILWADEDDKIHPFYEALYSEKYYDLEEAIEAVLEYY